MIRVIILKSRLSLQKYLEVQWHKQISTNSVIRDEEPTKSLQFQKPKGTEIIANQTTEIHSSEFPQSIHTFKVVKCAQQPHSISHIRNDPHREGVIKWFLLIERVHSTDKATFSQIQHPSLVKLRQQESIRASLGQDLIVMSLFQGGRLRHHIKRTWNTQNL